MTKSSRLAGGASRIGRALGGSIGGKASKAARKETENPVIGAVVGAATLFVANKLLPRRVAAVGAAIAAGYVTRKLAQRAERAGAREERTERMQVREGRTERMQAREERTGREA
ncbi:MAG: hypothetical protein ABL874_01765 [Sphingopyxis sp.]